MKKIMILEAGILQLPAIKKAKEMGLSVIAVDMDPNAVGFALSLIHISSHGNRRRAKKDPGNMSADKMQPEDSSRAVSIDERRSEYIQTPGC